MAVVGGWVVLVVLSRHLYQTTGVIQVVLVVQVVGYLRKVAGLVGQGFPHLL